MIPHYKIMPLYSKTLNKLLLATRELYPDLLPNEEDLSVMTVSDKAWGAYNFKILQEEHTISGEIKILTKWCRSKKLKSWEGFYKYYKGYAHNKQKEILMLSKFP
ncbi:MAG: hypothetical protein ACFFG0_06975 [Candidatus Thorarchaeota archaeon]